jgi:hypothetical protein
MSSTSSMTSKVSISALRPVTQFRRWHLALIPIPLVGWLLLVAYLLDEAGGPTPRRAELRVEAPRHRRLTAGLIDLSVAACVWWLLPPAPAWLIASAYLLFRDGGSKPFSLGKRLLKIRVCGPDGRPVSGAHTYVGSFERNLPLLVPYLGPLVEASLTATVGWRIGDRLARPADR